jgi:hypothetical protein
MVNIMVWHFVDVRVMLVKAPKHHVWSWVFFYHFQSFIGLANIPKQIQQQFAYLAILFSRISKKVATKGLSETTATNALV